MRNAKIYCKYESAISLAETRNLVAESKNTEPMYSCTVTQLLEILSCTVQNEMFDFEFCTLYDEHENNFVTGTKPRHHTFLWNFQVILLSLLSVESRLKAENFPTSTT